MMYITSILAWFLKLEYTETLHYELFKAICEVSLFDYANLSLLGCKECSDSVCHTFRTFLERWEI